MDFPLSDGGRQQARLAGRALSAEDLDAAYSSPLSRAYETAQIVTREAHLNGPVTPVDGLTERGGGVLEGHTWAEQEERNPELAQKFLRLPEAERWTLVGAETDEEILARFEAALAWIRDRHPDGARLAIVSHGGVMRAYLRDRFGEEVLPGTRRAANASVTRVRLQDGKGPRLIELASTRHLDGETGSTPQALE